MTYFSVKLKVGFHKHGLLAARKPSVCTDGFGNVAGVEWRLRTPLKQNK